MATYRTLIICANSLDPDQDRLNVCPDLDLNLLTCLKELFEKVCIEKSQQLTTNLTPCSIIFVFFFFCRLLELFPLKINVFKSITVSNMILDPDLCRTCLQRLSAYDTSRISVEQI